MEHHAFRYYVNLCFWIDRHRKFERGAVLLAEFKGRGDPGAELCHQAFPRYHRRTWEGV